jgi:hypothetical protein
VKVLQLAPAGQAQQEGAIERAARTTAAPEIEPSQPGPGGEAVLGGDGCNVDGPR